MPTDHYRSLFEDDFSGSDTFVDLPSLGDLRGSDETFSNMFNEPPASDELPTMCDLLESDELFSDMISELPMTGEMSNSGNCQYNSRSSQGCNGPSQMTNQFAHYGDEELELRNRKRKSQESQTATSERISDVLEKGSIAENVVPDAAQSMSGEKLCIKVPFHISVEVPRTTDSLLLKRIIVEKAVVALEEQIDTLLQVKKYEIETIIQSETVFPHESWPKPKPSQSPVQEYVNVPHQGRMIGNEIKIPPDTGIYYENKIEPKPPQTLVSRCLQSGANLIPHPCDIPHPSTRYAPTPDVVPQETYDRNTHTLGHKIQGHNDPVKFVSMAIDEGTSSSRELMVSPGANVNTLVPHQVCPKSNSSKKNKGSCRKNKDQGSKNEGPSHKPYERSEVEALVKAVEKYGIGRWQQVYNEAFKNDDTRNGDDMRDKWRSLVKTARRPPLKRRGTALLLPEELLKKVLELEGAKGVARVKGVVRAKGVARANGTSKPNRLRVKPTKSKC